MKLIWTLLVTCISVTLFSQQSGEVNYTEIFKPVMEMPDMPQLDGFDIDLSSFMPDSIVTEMKLSFTPEASMYSTSVKSSGEDPTDSSFEQQNENSSVQVSMSFSSDEGSSTTYKEVSDSTCLVQSDFMGQKFLITKSVSEYTWKFHNDKISYLGYECLKATTSDVDGQEIVVWYTPQILVPEGPADFSGLPGLILLVSSSDGNLQIKATEVNLEKTPEIKAPKKGKKVTEEEFLKIQEEKTKELEKMYGGGGNVIIIQD